MEEQAEQMERGGEEGFAKGILAREVEEEVGWDDKRVCEYRHTGQLDLKLIVEISQSKRAYRLSPHLLKHMQWKV